MKIGAIEDHSLLRKSYKLLLSNFEWVIEADNGQDMIEQLEQQDENNYPELLIVDINMPVMDGFETVSWLKLNHPNIKIVVISERDDETTILRMIKLGVDSYLIKRDLSPNELTHAISEVSKKGRYYTGYVAEIIVKLFQKSNLTDIEMKIQSLSEKEITILNLICKEFPSNEIADKLNTSPRTIESYVQKMIAKLEVKTRIGLALFAQKHGLLN